jgi:hypothetical protein
MADTPYGAPAEGTTRELVQPSSGTAGPSKAEHFAPGSGATEQQQFTPRQERAIAGIKERFAQLPPDERVAVLNEVTTWLKATPPGQEAMHAKG